MSRRFTGDTLVLATHNQGKIREISVMLAPYVAHFPTATSLNLPEPEETGMTFAANAELKALAAAKASGLPALADDSGLCVDALGGDPGIYSARWAGSSKDFAAASQKILDMLGNQNDRRASFVCALSLAWPDGLVQTVEGVLNGQIAHHPEGTNGFGYDPIFIPEGFDDTLGMLDPDEKAVISHRGRAFDMLVKAYL